MGRNMEPVEVVLAKGKKHLTKAEIEERRAREIKPLDGEIIAPDYLTKKEKAQFYEIAEKLQRLKIMGETDVDALGRYITANGLYINAVKMLRKTEVKNNPDLLEAWSKIQERYFKQARASANDLGLTISSRCKLVVPDTEKETPKENKFKCFEKGPAN